MRELQGSGGLQTDVLFDRTRLGRFCRARRQSWAAQRLGSSQRLFESEDGALVLIMRARYLPRLVSIPVYAGKILRLRHHPWQNAPSHQ
jgi:hypothetical protein